MNTERSEEFIKSWEKRGNPLKRAGFTTERAFRTSPEALASLICPAREYDWIPGWSCEVLHSESGYAEFGAVFRTTFRGREETWVCTRYEPNQAIDWAITGQGTTSKLEFSVIDNHDGTVTGRWVISISPLAEDQNQTEDELAQGGRQFEGLLDLLEHYVHTGEMKS